MLMEEILLKSILAITTGSSALSAVLFYALLKLAREFKEYSRRAYSDSEKYRSELVEILRSTIHENNKLLQELRITVLKKSEK